MTEKKKLCMIARDYEKRCKGSDNLLNGKGFAEKNLNKSFIVRNFHSYLMCCDGVGSKLLG